MKRIRWTGFFWVEESCFQDRMSLVSIGRGDACAGGSGARWRAYRLGLGDGDTGTLWQKRPFWMRGAFRSRIALGRLAVRELAHLGTLVVWAQKRGRRPYLRWRKPQICKTNPPNFRIKNNIPRARSGQPGARRR